MSEAYEYCTVEPNSIRILTLNAGSPDDDLSFRLQCYELNHLPGFSALSYSWGDFERGHDCFCEDVNSRARISISPNLWSALRQLRKADDHIKVWADQICIDQKNDQEKEEQIRLMGSIYGRAKDVIVWLGEADEDTAMLFQHIDDVGQQIRCLVKSLGPDKAHDPKDPGAAHYPLQLSPGDAREWVAFRQLFRRPWFSRVWTFQELVLSTAAFIVCGSNSIRWDWFHLICSTVAAYDRQGPETDSRLDHSSLVCQHMSQCQVFRRDGRFEGLSGGKDQLRLLDLLFHLMHRKTSLPHDKIYGLLGVAEDIDATKFPINYKQHFHDLYAQMTKFFIHQYADLTVLSLVNAGTFANPSVEGPKNLPSWVPDYRFNNFQKNNLRLYNGPKAMLHGKKRLYNATGSSSAIMHGSGSLSRSELILQGVHVGIVDVVSEPDGNTYTNEVMKLGENVLTGGSWSQIAAACGIDGIYIPTGESIEQAFTRLRIVDYLPEETNAQHRQSRGVWRPIAEPQANANLLQRTDEIGRRVMTATFRQRLFVTDSGHMGLAHQSVTVGDEIFLLTGGHMPFVLRRLAHGTFCFKGEAYVHGIMDGEYLVKQFKSTDAGDQDWLEGLGGAHSNELRTEVIILS